MGCCNKAVNQSSLGAALACGIIPPPPGNTSKDTGIPPCSIASLTARWSSHLRRLKGLKGSLALLQLFSVAVGKPFAMLCSEPKPGADMSIMKVNPSQARLFTLLHHGGTQEDLAWCSQPAVGLQLGCLERIKSPWYKTQSESLCLMKSLSNCWQGCGHLPFSKNHYFLSDLVACAPSRVMPLGRFFFSHVGCNEKKFILSIFFPVSQ